MKAVIIGASGATGKAITEELLEDESFDKIITLLRRHFFEDSTKLEEEIVDFDSLETSLDEITGEKAFSCLGTTLKAAGSKENQRKIDFDYQLNFAKLAKKNNIPVFVLVSSMGADSNSGFFYMKLKGELEEEVKKLGFKHLLIFRPGPLIRPDTDRLNEKISVPIIQFFNRLGILKRYKPISVKDLAKVMVEESKSPKPGIRVYEPDQIFELIN